jgi:CheY-like chemotaxis protein
VPGRLAVDDDEVTRLFHFVQTANGAYASDRIIIGFQEPGFPTPGFPKPGLPKAGAGSEQGTSLGEVFRIGRRFGSMPEPLASRPPGTITVLSFSPAESDHGVLERTFRESSLTLYPNCRLALRRGRTIASTVAALRAHRIPIVLCDLDGQAEAWREILQASRDLPAPPCVIVTSRVADDRLWAELLNGGAFDLLAKPFVRSEVIRIVHSAWVHWYNRHGGTDRAEACREPATGS